MNHFGYYGKTVHRGDFVRHNLPQSFVTVWDDWMVQLMIKGEAKHGDNWSTIYSQTPTYRFGLSPAIAGDDAWIGLFFPSTDKVGRRFPFCFTCALPEGIPPITGDQQGDNFFEPLFVELEQLGRDVQSQEFDYDSLQPRLATLQEDFSSRREYIDYTRFYAGHSDGKAQLAVVGDATTLLHTKTGLANLLDATLQQTCFHYSQWISTDSTLQGNTAICAGLPSGNLGLALFDGEWSDSGAGILDTSVLAQSKISTGSTDTYIPESNSPLTEATPETPESLDQEIHTNQTIETEPHQIEKDHEALNGSSVHEEPAVQPTVETLELEDDSTADDPWN